MQAEANVELITVIFFSLVFLCATQDVAVDGMTCENEMLKL